MIDVLKSYSRILGPNYGPLCGVLGVYRVNERYINILRLD